VNYLGATVMDILIMFNSTKTLLFIEIVRLEIYLAERPMLTVRVAPYTLVDKCYVVDHGRCTMMFVVQCTIY
jgi:hypothetical protein